jgi:hypothetical protein
MEAQEKFMDDWEKLVSKLQRPATDRTGTKAFSGP